MSQSPDKTSQDLSLLQVSDHPRMRHSSADGNNEENNYENFAHELNTSHSYLPWSPMTNTRDLTNPAQGLHVNSRPTSNVSMSPERRLDIVLGSGSGSGSEISRFSDQTPGCQQMARPIPTFNSFGIHQDPEELHRARPAYVPTPSPGGSDHDLAPPLPARSLQPQVVQQPLPSQSLPYFPFHQFPGRSVKPMRKILTFCA